MAGAYSYQMRSSSRAKKTSGKSFVAKGKKPALGQGGRFSALRSALSKKGSKNPGGLAAWIGRKKYGKSKFQKLAAGGRMRSK